MVRPRWPHKNSPATIKMSEPAPLKAEMLVNRPGGRQQPKYPTNRCCRKPTENVALAFVLRREIIDGSTGKFRRKRTRNPARPARPGGRTGTRSSPPHCSCSRHAGLFFPLSLRPRRLVAEFFRHPLLVSTGSNCCRRSFPWIRVEYSIFGRESCGGDYCSEKFGLGEHVARQYY